jgi:dTDP-4-dehydrorhamnose 3,5-epimerase
MIFNKVPLNGNLYVLELQKLSDSRGFFSRTVCTNEFKQYGLNSNFIQQSISFNPFPFTVRGMHWQKNPFSEEKLVRVTKGAIFDVVVDIDPHSSTFKKWFSVELTEENRKQIYVPKGFAHGFQTLLPNTEVQYEMTTQYNPSEATGFFWGDPEVGIKWPEESEFLISETDRQFPDLESLASRHKLSYKKYKWGRA